MHETRGTRLSSSHYPTMSLLSGGRSPLYIYSLKAWSHIWTICLAEEGRTDQFNPLSILAVLFFLKKIEREVLKENGKRGGDRGPTNISMMKKVHSNGMTTFDLHEKKPRFEYMITYLKHMFITMFINMMLLTYLSSSKLLQMEIHDFPFTLPRSEII